MRMKQILKKIYFKNKYRTLSIGKNVNIAINSNFEGKNKIMDNTFFGLFRICKLYWEIFNNKCKNRKILQHFKQRYNSNRYASYKYICIYTSSILF